MSDPLAGVLDKLLARERIGPPTPRATPVPTAVPEPGSRRMVVVAGPGGEASGTALRRLAAAARRRGIRPAVVDLAPGAEETPATGAAAVPLAALPGGVPRFRAGAATARAAALARLAEFEGSSDLLLVRVAPGDAPTLAAAVFLSGGLVVPVASEDDLLFEAFRVARSLADCLVGVRIVPLGEPEAVVRFTLMARDFLGLDLGPGTGEEAALSATLSPPPREGFLPSLLAPDDTPAAPSAPLIWLGSLPLDP